ncbi:MAG: hypothetical protein OEY03_03555 [Rhizobacter sp.]|nr:hypothetical protein [Rhizobacter sp.]
MPERATHALRVGPPVTVGRVTVIPIERIVLNSDQCDSRLWFSATKQPFAIVVHDAGGLRCIDTGTGTVSLEELRATVPGLDTVLARCGH